jgi:hypothetical protein
MASEAIIPNTAPTRLWITGSRGGSTTDVADANNATKPKTAVSKPIAVILNTSDKDVKVLESYGWTFAINGQILTR